jgi:uncharacterized membrane protein
VNQKLKGAQCPPTSFLLRISKHNDKSTWQQCILPLCFVARLQQETQKQEEKKHVHTQTIGATTKQKRKHKKEEKAYFSMKSVINKQ